jgi:hypothetical protein
MIIEQRLKRSITQRKDDVFVRSDFAQFGSPAQVSRALKQFVEVGLLVKLGIGVYAKAKKSVLTGNAIPVKPVDVLAPVALKKLGVSVGPGKLAQAYNSRESTQLPAGTVLNTRGRKISRKLGFGGRYIKYETTRT